MVILARVDLHLVGLLGLILNAGHTVRLCEELLPDHQVL